MQRKRVPERRRGERERATSRARLHKRNSEREASEDLSLREKLKRY